MKYLLIVCSSIFILGTTVFPAGLIDISYSPYTISQPGSYIVVADLHTPQDMNCITIATSDVTIDLNGHSLYGAGSSMGTNGCGIYGIWYLNNVSIKNGIIRNFREDGIALWGSNHQIQNIHAYNNANSGIFVFESSIVQNCTAEANGGGIGGGYGVNITNNTVRNNGYNGIGTGYGCIITGNSAYGNMADGIWAGMFSSVIGNNCSFNKSDGIFGQGYNIIKDNVTASNTDDGIHIQDSCLVTNNNCFGNGYDAGPLSQSTAYGIHAISSGNSIENNLLTYNDIGLFLEFYGSFYASNRAHGNSISNYSIGTGNIDGGLTNSALTNFSFYFQPNPVIQQIVGYDIPTLREAEATTPIRSVRW